MHNFYVESKQNIYLTPKTYIEVEIKCHIKFIYHTSSYLTNFVIVIQIIVWFKWQWVCYHNFVSTFSIEPRWFTRFLLSSWNQELTNVIKSYSSTTAPPNTPSRPRTTFYLRNTHSTILIGCYRREVRSHKPI